MAPKPLLDKDTPRSDAPPGEKLSNREAINQTLNEPSYSPLAMIISNVVMISIVISTVSFVISSMPAFQDEGSKAALAVVEVVVVGIFTVEYVCRFTVYPGSRCAFVVSPMNMIDLVAILPFYVEKLSGGGEKMAVLRVLRVVRIFRVFKLMSKSKMAETNPHPHPSPHPHPRPIPHPHPHPIPIPIPIPIPNPSPNLNQVRWPRACRCSCRRSRRVSTRSRCCAS